MLYSNIPQDLETYLINLDDEDKTLEVAYCGYDANWAYRLDFGVQVLEQNRSGEGKNVPNPGAVRIDNLITCAHVSYIYCQTGAVVHVAVFHAHTGWIPSGELPTKPKYNVRRIPARDIHVVFASSQAVREDNPYSGIQTAASGIFDLIAAGIPKENIRIIAGVGSSWGVNSDGEVGIEPRWTWPTANLPQLLTNAVNAAQAAYDAQFRPGATKIGPFGSTHNKTEADRRINALNADLARARNDRHWLNKMQAFFEGDHSYKAGSLKLHMVTELFREIGTVLPAYPHPVITTANAESQWRALFRDIRQGII